MVPGTARADGMGGATPTASNRASPQRAMTAVLVAGFDAVPACCPGGGAKAIVIQKIEKRQQKVSGTCVTDMRGMARRALRGTWRPA